MPDSPFHLQIDPEALRPLIRAAAAEAVAAFREAEAKLPERLAFDEREAARLLGMNPHQLRDERRRKRIQASKIVGGRIRYSKKELLRYLDERKV
jgi:hypothetical protein